MNENVIVISDPDAIKVIKKKSSLLFMSSVILIFDIKIKLVTIEKNFPKMQKIYKFFGFPLNER